MKFKSVLVFSACLVLLGIAIARSHTFGGLRPNDETGVSTAPGKAAVLPFAVDDFSDHQSDEHSIRWFYSDTPDELKGVAMVIHGLNLRPDKMLPIISRLTESGIDVLRLSLRGHGDNYTHQKKIDNDTARLETFKAVSYPLWMNEAYLAYLQVNERAEQKEAPLFLAAFSLGGLIGLDLFASNPEVAFDRLVLFAPAIALRPTIYLERALSPFPRLVIPSLAPETYLANRKGTPIAAYNALFEGLYHFEKNAGSKLNVPTMIFIDEQDEFIPLWKLKKLVEENRWDQWQFYIVQKEKEMKTEAFHHHIIDASSTGNAVWQDIMNTAMTHLLESWQD